MKVHMIDEKASILDFLNPCLKPLCGKNLEDEKGKQFLTYPNQEHFVDCPECLKLLMNTGKNLPALAVGEVQWIKLKKEFEERLENAVPPDLKEFVGIIDAKGYCPICNEKKVLFLNRKSKQSFCSDCIPAIGYEFTAIEFDNMWQLARDMLYYANEVIMELKYPNVDFSTVTPTNMSLYLLSRGWNKKPFGNENVWKFTNTLPRGTPIEFVVLVPARIDLIDYKRTIEIVIETISVFEKRSPYEVFLDLSR